MRAVLIALLLAAASPCVAEDARKPEAAALAEELIALTQAEQGLAQMRGQVQEMIIAGTSNRELPEHLQGLIAEHQRRMTDLVFETLSWDKMRDDYVAIYTEVFSLDELRGLVAFFRSPTGRAYTEKSPLLMQRTEALVQARTDAVMPQVRQMAAELMQAVQSQPAPPADGGQPTGGTQPTPR